MSVVVWDGRYLATDRMAESDGFKIEVVKSIILMGEIMAWTGGIETGIEMAYWRSDGAEKSKLPAFQMTNDWSRLIVLSSAEKELIEYQKGAFPIRWPKNKPIAFGAGRDVATGALAMGANAKQAVEIAIMHNCYCGFGIDIYDSKTMSKVEE